MKVWPVRYRQASEHRKRATGPMSSSGSPLAAHRVVLQELPVLGLGPGGGVLPPLRSGAWCDGVDHDAVPAPLTGGRTGERPDRLLGHVVGAVAGHAGDAGGGREVDDPPPSLRPPCAGGRSASRTRCPSPSTGSRRGRPLPRRRAPPLAVKVWALLMSPSTPPKRSTVAATMASTLVLVGDVGDQPEDPVVGTQLGQGGQPPLQPVLLPLGDGDRGPVGHEVAGHPQPDALARPGDDDPLALHPVRGHRAAR